MLVKHDFLDIALPKSAGTQSFTGVNVVLIESNEYLYYKRFQNKIINTFFMTLDQY